MIKPKYGICIDCTDGIQKPLIAKRCQFHYWKNRSKVSREIEIITPTVKLHTTPTELVLWYGSIMKKEEPVCWECGSKINKYNATAWHGSVAHILPKSIFPSIKTHPHNYLILGMYCGCHGQFDSNWLNASKMKVIEVAKKRFNQFKSDISDQEKRKIPEIFLS